MLTDLPKATLMEALSQLSFSPNNSTLGQAAKNGSRTNRKRSSNPSFATRK